MEVRVKLWGFSEIIPAFRGNEEVPVDFDGQKVNELILRLFPDMDPVKKRTIFADGGEISSEFTIIINGRIVPGLNRFNRRLRGGDFIELVLAPG